MKNVILFSALFMAGIISAAAQNTPEVAIKKMWHDVYEAYNSGDTEKGLTYYTESALEIGPDGTLLSGKKAIRENWVSFMKMLDEKPVFNYSNPSVKMVTPEVAIITWDSNDEMKIQGQKVSSKMKGIAVVHKINGQWLVEADSIIPVTQMPDPSQTAKN